MKSVSLQENSSLQNAVHNEDLAGQTQENVHTNPVLAIQELVYQKIRNDDDISEEELTQEIEECISVHYRKHMLSIKQREQLYTQVFNAIRKMGILQELIEDDSITEIMMNGYQNIFVERAGRIVALDRQFESEEQLEQLAHKIAAMSNRIVNESVPIVDTRLSDGSRVNIVLPPVALNGPVITIRKFYDTPMTIERLISFGSITQEAADFLQRAVRARYNIFISGGTGCGKTTFLNALSNFIPQEERVITIEDSAELQIRNVKNLVRLEARNANVEGENAVTIRDLIRSSLRMRPDRIVVGEVRGAEALDMLQAMNTGHDGSLSTGHSNSAQDMLMRIETMVLMGMEMPVAAIRQQIESAIDIVVHLSRLRDKSRKVMRIEEVRGIADGKIQLNTLYEYREEGEDESGRIIGTLRRTDNPMVHTEKMQAAGYTCDENRQKREHFLPDF